MTMNRRDWLKAVFGATAAATLAPLVDLTDTTPAFWSQPAIRALHPWRITFPDGAVYTFDAEVVAERISEPVVGAFDCSFTLRPTGAMTLEESLSPATPAALHVPDGRTMELVDLTPPSMERAEVDATSWGDDEPRVLGVMKRGTLTIRGRFVE